MNKDRILLCAIAKNEKPYILEWIAYHKVIGFDHTVIFDNDSTDGASELLASISKFNFVDSINRPRKGEERPQYTAYRHALSVYGANFDWICFLDLDEFLVLHLNDDIHDFVLKYREYDAIAINWLVFGSSGEKRFSNKLVIERFRKSSKSDNPINRHVKSLIKCSSIIKPDIHVHYLKEGSRYVYADGTLLDPILFSRDTSLHVKTDYAKIDHSVAQINHYQAKSEEEFAIRKNRGRATVPAGNIQSLIKPGEFEQVDSGKNLIEDLTIQTKLASTKKLIKKLSEGIPTEQASNDPVTIQKMNNINVDSVPLWAPGAIGYVATFLAEKNGKAKVLEFGSGGSTIWLANYAHELHVIEHHEEWYEAVKNRLERSGLINNTHLKLLNTPYDSAADSFSDAYFDLVIVDGRDRVNCAKKSLRLVKNGGLLIMDDAQRTRYSEMRNLLEAFPTQRFFSPHRSTQYWIINRNINYSVNATTNPW